MLLRTLQQHILVFKKSLFSNVSSFRAMAEKGEEGGRGGVKCERPASMGLLNLAPKLEPVSGGGPETSRLQLQRDVGRRLKSFGLFTEYPAMYVNAPTFAVNGFVYRGM